MGRPKKEAEPKLLTDVELELMTVLWQTGEATVRDVLEQLPANRQLAYTSVSTVLRILEKKKLVQTRKDGKAHLYAPAVSKTDYESRSVRDLVDKVFDGTPSAMVMRLLDDEGMSAEELREIQARLKERLEP
ncbi:transcriptional regulator [Acidobacteria bacterium Mor1]|nr:transcriptional regulator [Acidobacteria bacterium Mor1]